MSKQLAHEASSNETEWNNDFISNWYEVNPATLTVTVPLPHGKRAYVCMLPEGWGYVVYEPGGKISSAVSDAEWTRAETLICVEKTLLQ